MHGHFPIPITLDFGAVALTYPDSYKITIPPTSSIDGKDNRFDFYLRTTFFHNCWKQANIMPIVAQIYFKL